MRAVERLLEMFLGDSSRISRMLQQDQFAFDAQQLGKIPAFVAGYAASKRLIDSFESRSDFTGLSETSRQFAEQQECKRRSKNPSLTRPGNPVGPA
jgi:hypothetical protein